MKKSDKKEHSIFSNIFYFIGIMFKISPFLVIGECLSGIIDKLPTRLIAVIGVKYVIDVAQSDDKSRIIYAVAAIAVLLLISEVFNWLFREFYWNLEKEKLTKGLNTKFFNKAKSLDLEAYDNPHFYNSFVLAIESSSGHIQGILGMVSRYIGELVSLIAICSVILTIDPICLVIILITIIIFTPLGKKIGTLQSQRRIDNNRFHRRADYFARIFYLQDYAKEVRMNNIRPLLIERYNDAADDVIENQRKYVKKIDTIYFFQEGGLQIMGFMFILPLYLGYCVLKTHTLSTGDFVATFNGAFSVASSFSFLTIFVARNFSEQAKMIEKYREFLKEKNKIFDGNHTADSSKVEVIELKNVSFTYPGNSEPTLKNISLTLKPKEKIALVGYNGAGKTTLIKSILNILHIDKGSIKIFDKDYQKEENLIIEDIGDKVGYLFQVMNDMEPFTSANNLTAHKGSLNLDFERSRKNMVLPYIYGSCSIKEKERLLSPSDFHTAYILELYSKYKIEKIMMDDLVRIENQIAKRFIDLEKQLTNQNCLNDFICFYNNIIKIGKARLHQNSQEPID